MKRKPLIVGVALAGTLVAGFVALQPPPLETSYDFLRGTRARGVNSVHPFLMSSFLSSESFETVVKKIEAELPKLGMKRSKMPNKDVAHFATPEKFAKSYIVVSVLHGRTNINVVRLSTFWDRVRVAVNRIAP